ncbi:DUF3224 domain-containing protein [Actinomadura rudentiformis]|uniref:DUF3224 domain-containing protein n=2 Tax=Actinomadura rudentiformis TaxID=359158 RepID=A0A6H9YHN0_9ACTN|nr:DUF3224 domain-containing protein [Actinomadura rudentiformis]
MTFMTLHAGGTFDIDAWDAEKPYEEENGTKLSRVQVGKTFHGDMVGTSTAELLTVETQAGPAAYVGLETVRAILHGREGTFVLQHSAGGGAEGQWLRWEIVATSGTGELAGIQGRGTIEMSPDGGHSWTLDYTLD